MKDTLKMKLRVLLVILLSITLTILSVSIILSIRDSRIYPSNIELGNLSIGNIPKTQMNYFIKEAYLTEKLRLSLPDKKIELDLYECGITLNYDATIEKIEPEVRLIHNVTERGTTKVVTPVFKWDGEILSNKLDNIVAEYTIPAVNAQIIYTNNDVVLIPHTIGKSIDKTILLENVEKSLLAGNLAPIIVEVEEIKPIMTLQELQHIEKTIEEPNKLNKIDGLVITIPKSPNNK